MSSSVTIRFPEGTEFRLSESVPKVGDTLTKNGDSWVVVEVEPDRDGDNSTVTLRPAEEPS